MVTQGSIQVGERDIVLGLHIPDYPMSKKGTLHSGREVGEEVLSFTPYHAWGADKGTKTCPVCKYGWYHGILYFAGNYPDWREIKQWLHFLEAESSKRQRRLKVYFVYGNEAAYSKAKRESELESLGKELRLNNVALTFVPSFSDKASEVAFNKISQTVENTFILYKRSRIIDTFINLKPNAENFHLITGRLDETMNEYFDLPHQAR